MLTRDRLVACLCNQAVAIHDFVPIWNVVLAISRNPTASEISLKRADKNNDDDNAECDTRHREEMGFASS